MKHFEDLWQDAESIENDTDVSSILLELTAKVGMLDNNLPIEGKLEIFGEVLYSLAKLSKAQNLNAYKALRKSIVKRLVNYKWDLDNKYIASSLFEAILIIISSSPFVNLPSDLKHS